MNTNVAQYSGPHYLFSMVSKRFLPLSILLLSCGTPLPYSGSVIENELRLNTKAASISFTFCSRKKAPRSGAGIIIIPAAPGDRNWNMGPIVTNSGLLLARTLAMAGFFTLRFDPPGRGQSELNEPLTPDNQAETLRRLHLWLKSRGECRGKSIVWIAHGDSAFTALLAARKTPPDGIILISPPGMPMGKALLTQVRDALRRRNVEKRLISINIAYLEKALQQLKTGKKLPKPDGNTTESVINTAARLFDRKQTRLLGWLMATDPLSLVRPGYRLRILFGERDAQYPPSIHARPWMRYRNVKQIPLMDYMLREQPYASATLKPVEILKSYTDQKRPLSTELVRAIENFIKNTNLQLKPVT